MKLGDIFSLSPNTVFMFQGNATEFNIGTMLEYNLPDNDDPDAYFAVGAYYRLKDALIAGIGFGYKNFSLGITYDINLSSLSVASSNKGGLEISLIYQGSIEQTIQKMNIECPRW